MNNVVENIEYLVWRHDCVVLPTWGAFIARYESARFDLHCRKVYPPLRQITFNPDVDHNDGLLATSIARRQSISFDKASRIVATEVESMRHQLNRDGEVSLGNIGRFVRQAESTVIFEPSALVGDVEYGGFAPVEANEVFTRAREEAAIQKTPTRRRHGLVKAIRVAAAIAIVALAGGIVTIPTFDRNDTFASVSSTEMFSSQAHSQADPAAVAPDTDFTVAHIELDNMPDATSALDETIADDVIADAAPADVIEVVDAVNVVEQPTIVANPRYCLVVASLASQALADKYLSDTNQEGLQVMQQDDRFRVYIAVAATADELEALKRSPDIAAKYPDAWVCRIRR